MYHSYFLINYIGPPKVFFLSFSPLFKKFAHHWSKESWSTAMMFVQRPEIPMEWRQSFDISKNWAELHTHTYIHRCRGKQWQTTPKNLPRMQRARAIPVTWLGSGSCQARLSRLNTNEWWMNEWIHSCVCVCVCARADACICGFCRPSVADKAAKVCTFSDVAHRLNQTISFFGNLKRFLRFHKDLMCAIS